MYTKKIYFSGGSFYELQEVFDHVPGVQETRAGCIHGDAGEQLQWEVMGIEVTYDPKKMDISQLMDILFAVVDPCLPEGQGNAVGPLYRCGVYYVSGEDEPQIEYHMQFIRNRGRFSAITETNLTINDPDRDLGRIRTCYARAMPFKDFQAVEPEYQHYLERHPTEETYIDFDYLHTLGVLV